MAQDSVITLIGATAPRDGSGIPVPQDVPRTIFCRADSVPRGEFFQAGQAGYSPQWKFTVFQADYRNEATVEFEGQRYGIYRTYRVPGTDYMELYAERKAGVVRGKQ